MAAIITLLGGSIAIMYALKWKNKPTPSPHSQNFTLSPKKLLQEGGEYRHVTFDSIADYISHPDVQSNLSFISGEKGTVNRGEYGMERLNRRMHPGGNITQIYRTENLIA